ncbi:MAG: histidine phosphatase family protein, partial [Planctomycetota bacterium]
MTRTLILMRHAKSSWDDPGLTDHDRPLNRRGRLAAPLMAAWLAEIDAAPDHALVSSAIRA